MFHPIIMVLLFGLRGLFALPMMHQDSRSGSGMDSIDQQVSEKFSEFVRKQDPALIHEALDLIEGAESKMSFAQAAERKLALSRRLSFFSALDRNIDSAWDMNKVPPKGVPPPLSHGIVYSSGEVDPSTIPDPAERAKYEKALSANRDDNRHFFVQFQLRRINDRAMLFTDRLIAARYTNSKEDKREFEELLAASKVNESRKDALRAFMAEHK